MSEGSKTSRQPVTVTVAVEMTAAPVKAREVESVLEGTAPVAATFPQSSKGFAFATHSQEGKVALIV